MAVKASILKRLVTQLERKGMTPSKAHAVAKASLQQAGVLQPGTNELTKYGEKRQGMGAAGRAKDKAARKSNKKPSEYKYNPKTNTATLKKSK